MLFEVGRSICSNGGVDSGLSMPEDESEVPLDVDETELADGEREATERAFEVGVYEAYGWENGIGRDGEDAGEEGAVVVPALGMREDGDVA